MKLNLPSTLTSQKMSTLFLLTVLNSLPAESGSEFSSCLNNGNSTYYNNKNDFYNKIVDFGSSVTDKQNFCCRAEEPVDCAIMSPSCPVSQHITSWIQCNKINQSKFCVTYGYSENLGEACGGVIGNTVATNFTIPGGNCPSLDLVFSALNSQTSKFNLLCCGNENCEIINNKEVKYDTSSIANVPNVCLTPNKYSLMCFADNGGWSCTGNLGSTVNIWPNPIGDCVLQVSTIGSKSNTNSPSITSKPLLTTDQIITISLGIPGGIGAVVAAVLGYKKYKKETNNGSQPKKEGVAELGKLNESKIKNPEEVVEGTSIRRRKSHADINNNEQEQHAQIEVLPKH